MAGPDLSRASKGRGPTPAAPAGLFAPLPDTLNHVAADDDGPGLSLSRRPVTDSLVSFAGARDARSGLEWGGATANGGRLQLSYDNGDYGVYGYGGLHKLVGNHVESNSRAEAGTGVYWYLLNDDSRQLTAGLSLTGISYDKNQGNFTYGNGGYFSPQNFFSIVVTIV